MILDFSTQHNCKNPRWTTCYKIRHWDESPSRVKRVSQVTKLRPAGIEQDSVLSVAGIAQLSGTQRLFAAGEDGDAGCRDERAMSCVTWNWFLVFSLLYRRERRDTWRGHISILHNVPAAVCQLPLAVLYYCWSAFTEHLRNEYSCINRRQEDQIVKNFFQRVDFQSLT